MRKYNECKSGQHLNKYRKGRGPSSFRMQDPKLIFDEMKIVNNEVFLDLGCGAGDYALEASKRVGNEGIVYALDGVEGIINSLKEEVKIKGIKNILPIVSDITSALAVPNESVDVCFICTVLHALDLEGVKARLFEEICRVLKPDGRMFIVECKDEEMGFGPPLNTRISSIKLDQLVAEYHFEKVSYVDLGYNYMCHYRVQ